MKWIVFSIVLAERKKELSKEEHEKHFEASKKALKDVGLSDEKQKKAIVILKETHEKMRQLHENKSLKPEDAHEKEKSILMLLIKDSLILWVKKSLNLGRKISKAKLTKTYKLSSILIRNISKYISKFKQTIIINFQLSIFAR